MKLDIADNIDIFFKTFGIPKQEITIKQRDDLELFWMTKTFDDEIVIEGKKYEIPCNYSIIYETDQWVACNIVKTNMNKGKFYIEEVYTGEGDSTTLALLATFVLVRDYLNEEDLEYIRNIFQ